MKKLLLSLLLLVLSSALGAQTRYNSLVVVDNPPYGLVAQLWNASSSPIYLDAVSVTGSPVLPLPRGSNATLPVSFLEFGYGLSNLEESQCTAVNSFVMGGTAPVAAPVAYRVSAQPCTPHGRPYGQSNGDGTYNYTPTNFVSLEICIASYCRLDFAANPVIIPPNTGITIYTNVYDGVNGFGWIGYAFANFRWHDHTGCPAQPVNNPFCIQ